MANHPHLNSENENTPALEIDIIIELNIYTMATTLHDFNILNSIAMNRKTSIRHSQNYHQDGIGTVTILLAIATVFIIFYSIYNAI